MERRVHAPTRSRPSRLARLAAVIAVSAANIGGGASVLAAPASCALVPQLRDVTITQGVGSYPLLARGKEALVRLHLSLPSCAPTGSSIALTGASLVAKLGTTTLASVAAHSPAASTTPPTLAPHASAAAANSPADPLFVVPAAALAPASTTERFTTTFTASVTYSAKTSKTATATTGSAAFSTRPGSTSPITATVERRTKALRVLVVPMGDARQNYASQFDSVAKAATQNGMAALARMLPVPAGTGDLAGTTGGVRYSIDPTLLDLSALMTNGKFCGKSSNFDAIKGKLAQFLQSWNTANPANPGDRVLGVVKDTISTGSAGGCAEGMAALGGPEAWVRAIPDVSGSPSMTGSLMGMELSHTLGLVPGARDDAFSPAHSPNTQADATAPNRAYNTSLRSYLADDHTVTTLSGAWNNTTTVFERDDWAFLLCSLGGATTTECTSSGTVGTATGVGADPTFVISGTTNDSSVGTDVVESYFAPGVARSIIDPASPYRLVQLGPDGGLLRDDGVVVSFSDSNHDHDGPQSEAGSTGLFSVAVPFHTGADAVELWKGTPGAAGSQLLYSRQRNDPPRLTSFSVTPTGGGGGGGGATTERVSVDTAGNQANNTNFEPSVSADGRYVSFFSHANNLVAGDTNSASDVFVHDRQTGITQRVSVDSAGGQANGGSFEPSISADGRYVSFPSNATNLVPGDTNFAADVFVHDRQTGVTQRVSVDSAGGQANSTSVLSSISADGRYVGFPSDATNLVIGDTNNAYDVFVHDRQTGATERVSVDSAGGEGDLGGDEPSISADGRYVSFTSYSTNLVAGDTNSTYDVFVHDRQTALTERVSVDSAGGEGDSSSTRPFISGNGRYVSFTSGATNLVAGDTNSTNDVFVHDRQTAVTERVSVDSVGNQANSTSFEPVVNADGRFVSFWSLSGNLVAGDTNTTWDVFVHDRQTGATERVSVSAADGEGNGTSHSPSISADGQVVAFVSQATNLVAGDTNGIDDVFVRGLAAPPPPGDQQTVTTTAGDDQPSDLRLDLIYSCPAGDNYPVAVGERPESVTATTASFVTNFDASLACAGGTLSAVVNDGFSQAAPTAIDSAPAPSGPKAPNAAIYGPALDTTALQFDTLTLAGTGKDPEDGELAGTSLSWTLEGNGVTRTGTGTTVDLSPPAGGWAPGDYTVTLAVTDAAGQVSETTSVLHVLADADHDGIAASLEAQSCFPADADADASNAYADYDGDHIANLDDAATAGGPCTPPPLSAATVAFNPDPLSLSTKGKTVTAYVGVPGHNLAEVVGPGVRIVRIAGAEVSADPAFASLAWSVSGNTGTAKFDRSALSAYLSARGLTNQAVELVVAGWAAGGAWAFEDSDAVQIKR